MMCPACNHASVCLGVYATASIARLRRPCALTVRNVLHGHSYKRLAPPGITENKKHVQSNQTILHRHNSLTEHLAPSKRSPRVLSQNTNNWQRINSDHSVVIITFARLRHSIPQPLSRRHSRVNAKVVSANADQCAAQASRAALQHRLH